jgi:hypothetical protein
LLPFGFLLGSELGDGFFLGSEVETSGDDCSESQSILIERTDFSSAVFDDDELLDIFQSFSDDDETTSQSVSPPPATSPLSQMYSIQLSSPNTCHPTHPSSSSSPPYCPKKAYRQRAIARWLHKRQRRTFSKKVLAPAVRSQKLIPKRSSSNGRFVKSTTGFVSITALQSNPSDSD